LTLDLSWP